MKNIAIIGSGVSGLTAAYLLSKKHNVTVFEKNDRIGGHTATVDIEKDGETFAIDTGFIVFNDKTFEHFTLKKEAANTQIHVEHGRPLKFGKENDKGLRFNAEKFAIEVVTIGENGISEDDVLIHDETNKMMAHMLVELTAPEFPVVCGVIYCNPEQSYDEAVHNQMIEAKNNNKADFNALIRQGRTWTIE